MEKIVDKWRDLPARQADDPSDSSLGKLQRTRRRLLGFAMELFARQGYQGTTAAEIAAAAGVSRATFFLHFPTKAALLGELSREMADAWEAEAVPANERGVDALRRFVTFLFRETDPETVGTAAVGSALLQDFVETYGTDMSAGIGAGTLHDHATRLVTRAQAEGDWTKEWSAAVLAHVLLSSYNMIRADLAGKSYDQSAEAFLTLLSFGVRTPSASA